MIAQVSLVVTFPGRTWPYTTILFWCHGSLRRIDNIEFQGKAGRRDFDRDSRNSNPATIIIFLPLAQYGLD